MTPAEVLVPEQPTLSIKAAIAPQIADGLHAIVQDCLASASASKKPKAGGRSGDKIRNKVSGTVNGTLIQIGKVHGNLDDNRGR